MADDITSQLHDLAAALAHGQGRSTVSAAAAEIERLRAEVERLRAELDEERNRRQDDLVGNAWMEESTNRMRTAGDGLAQWVQDNGPGSTEDMTLLAQWDQARRS